MPTVTVIGIGADGWEGLSPAARDLIHRADVLLGGQRHLALLPSLQAEQRSWPSPLRSALPELMAAYAGRRVVVLASGDPLVSGIGTTLIELLGAHRVSIIPAVSSVALARARMGWAAESCTPVSLVGRDLSGLTCWWAPGRRLIVLSADEDTPAAVAALLVEQGLGDTRMSVWSDLGSAAESGIHAQAADWTAAVSRLNLICLQLPAVAPHLLAVCPGLPDDAFEHDGQLTKRDLRASALSRLAPAPGQLLWDVGAGAGSVGIEWMRCDPTCRTIAVESNPERAQRISRNARHLGVPSLTVVAGAAPEALIGLEAPDAVFIGGGARHHDVLDRCLQALTPGGRLVAHGVTLETEQLLAAAQQTHGGELTRISIETMDSLGTMRGWRPARTVTQWSMQR